MVTCEKIFRFEFSYVTNIMNYYGSQSYWCRIGGSGGSCGDGNTQLTRITEKKQETLLPWKISFEWREFIVTCLVSSFISFAILGLDFVVLGHTIHRRIYQCSCIIIHKMNCSRVIHAIRVIFHHYFTYIRRWFDLSF